MINLILFGPPAAGKGTQAQRLVLQRCMAQFSTGDILRAAVAASTELGVRVEAIMQQGLLVPDEIVVALIEEKLRGAPGEGGCIFDGFPRTIAQAEALDEMLARNGQDIDHVINLRVDHNVLLARIESRFSLFGRADDNPAALAVRLDEYRERTLPLLRYYKAQGRLKEVDGMADEDSVGSAIEEVLQGISEEVF